jgi:hypothetical protein
MWMLAAFVKWAVLLIAAPFARGFPPPTWVSVSGLVFLFGHVASEYFFPGGYRALEAVSKQPRLRSWHSLFLLVGGAGLLLVVFALLGHRFAWLPLAQVRTVLLVGLGAVISWCLLYVGFRDFLIYRHWPHELRNA